MEALFPLGQCVTTRNAFERIKAANTPVWELLTRHQSGDWGSVCNEDARENELSVKHGFRILSVYPIDANKPCEGNNRLWIITEADRSSTTVLLPEDY